MDKIRVLLVDDHGIVREGLRAMLSLNQDIQVVGEAADGREAIDRARSCAPNVVVMDMAMPGMDGLQATKRLTRDFPEVRVLVLSQHDNERYILPVLQAGASGYVLKRSVGAELVGAIRAVHAGDSWLPPRVAQAVLQYCRQGPSTLAEDEVGVLLTDREREVLKLVVDGYTSQEIADLLHLSKRTVMCHRANIASKLGIHNRMELIRYAMRTGLVEVA
jgi:DNA-binding NarL/FixJ family response regulator